MLKNMPNSPMLSSSVASHRADANPLPGAVSARSRTYNLIKSLLKGIAIVSGIIIAAVPALTSRVELYLTNRDPFFLFWGQTFAVLPGLPGIYFRKCYYFLTLRRCSLNCEIGFLTFIHDRRTQIGERVHIGSGVGVGWVSIGDGCLIASRVSILSGRAQHRIGSDGRLTPFDRNAAKQIHIGDDTWIGEGAIIMADVESHCVVGAGSIVTKPVTSGSLVAGNPARLIRRLIDGQTVKYEGEDKRPTP
jgi:virginiamycin A acetyltransferase